MGVLVLSISVSFLCQQVGSKVGFVDKWSFVFHLQTDYEHAKLIVRKGGLSTFPHPSKMRNH